MCRSDPLFEAVFLSLVSSLLENHASACFHCSRLPEHCEVDITDNFTTCHKTLNSRTANDRPVKIILLFCGKAMPR